MLKKSQTALTAEADELYDATEAPGLGPAEVGPADGRGVVCARAWTLQ